MLTFLATFAGGAGLYLLLCAATALCGRGLLRLGRAGVAAGLEWPLAAVLGSLFWALALGVAVGLRAPVRAVAPWLGGATLLLAAAGLWRPWAALRHGGLLAAACALLPLAALGATFRAGLTNTTETVAQDGWAYVAGGEYLWDFPRGAPADTSPIRLFGGTLAHQRYTGSAFLALLRPLTGPGDGYAAAALLEAWSLFVTACAVLLFWLAQGRRAWAALALTALTVSGGWLADVIWCNNIDHALSLACMPAMAALPALFGPRDWRRWALTAALLAGVLYTYPELAPFEIGGACLIALPAAWGQRGAWRAQLLGGAAAGAAAVLLLLPFLPVLTGWARGQVTHALAAPGARPGDGLFEGLYQGTAAALWGVCGESWGKPPRLGLGLYAEALTVLFVLGLAPLARRGGWGLSLTALLLGSAALYLLGARHYSYGAYKVLSVGWWCLAAVAFAGAERLLAHVPRPAWRGAAAAAACAGALLVQLGAGRCSAPLWPGGYGAGASAADFRPVRAVAEVTGGSPLLVAVDDWKANLLALYYLRDTPLYLAAYRSYLGGMAGLFERHRPAGLADVRYVLSDDTPASEALHAGSGALAWAGGHYRLWEAAPRAGDVRLLHVEARVVEPRDGRFFFWLREGGSDLYVYSARPGRLVLSGEFVVELAPPDGGRLSVRGPLGERQELPLTPGEHAVELAVPAGPSRIEVGPLPGGGRPLLVGVKGAAVRLAPGPEAGPTGPGAAPSAH